MQPLIGMYWKGAGVNSLGSGVSYATQPTDIAYNSLASEDNGRNVYEYVRISGTCTVGDLLYLTGTAMQYVTKSGTQAGMPYGVSLVAPTASGAWTYVQKYGICTSLQVTATVGGTAAGSAALYGGTGSAAVGASGYLSSIASGAVIGGAEYIGRSLTAATGSQTIAFINLL